ncbi:MAG: efflux RND transporter periplasmic adaptor subunit [Bacteroidota bacterium]
MRSIPAFILAGSFITISLLACKEKKAEELVISPDVNVVAVGQKTVPVYSEYVGETFGQEDIQIQSRVDGWITGIHFKEGDMVQKGQLLYTVDDLPIKNKIDQAQAKLVEANTGRVKNKSELDRVEPLTAMHALSQRDLDAAKAAYQASISQVDAAEAALRNAKIELDYTHINAPITGVIGISKVLVGDYIGKLTTAPLNTVSSIGTMRVRFSISEDEYLKFAKAKTNTDHKILQNQIAVQLVLSDGTVYPETGTISLSNRQIDPATGSLLIQAAFPNAKNLLRPGQYAKIRLQTDLYKDAILVPQQAVNQIQNIYQVFVVNDSNLIRPTAVKVGKRVGSNWIVDGGLQMGAKVAIVGSAIVNPKVPIKPTLISWNYDSTSN